MKANKVTPKSVLEYYWCKYDAIIRNIDDMTQDQV